MNESDEMIPVMILAPQGVCMVGLMSSETLKSRLRADCIGVITLEEARNVIYTSAGTGGLYGLCERGPLGKVRLGARLSKPFHSDVTSLLQIRSEAWEAIMAWPAVGAADRG